MLGRLPIVSFFFALSMTAIGAPLSAQTSNCKGDNGGLTLSPGFCATVFADNLGHVRHMVVAPDGTIYANSWSGRYFLNAPPAPPGAFLIALKDTKGDGRADVNQRFGPSPDKGGAGGSGIAFYRGAIYAEEKDRILRYPLTPGSLVPAGEPQIVVSGLPLTGDHPMHPFVIGANGDLFVDLGSISNACQAENRMKGAPGASPCVEKETRGGVWRYDANKTGQVFSPKERFASGIRNGEGFAFDAAGQLYATQHGRDQLYQRWPQLYTPEQGADLPAEEIVKVTAGADYGWPECYYDQNQKKLVLAPEYGGDGGKTVGLCAQRIGPVAAFPGHWAPNDLAIYSGTKFPDGYRGGAFIAFHGSWNRAPLPQAGYNVVFQPLPADGKAAGPYVVFAEGFAGAHKEPGRAIYRPTGLAVAPDGALFIADDVRGRIWRVTYNGNGSDKVAAAAAPAVAPRAAGRKINLPTPPGATAAQVALGDRIYHGQASNGTCTGCHGSDALGTPQGPPLNWDRWMWSDGSLAGISDIIQKGVLKPKRYQGAMPPYGGSPLSKEDLAAVTAYVWAVSHADGR
jgi:glucose/arabinose dehydrogenase/cytochrome c5